MSYPNRNFITHTHTEPPASTLTDCPPARAPRDRKLSHQSFRIYSLVQRSFYAALSVLFSYPPDVSFGAPRSPPLSLISPRPPRCGVALALAGAGTSSLFVSGGRPILPIVASHLTVPAHSIWLDSLAPGRLAPALPGPQHTPHPAHAHASHVQPSPPQSSPLPCLARRAQPSRRSVGLISSPPACLVVRARLHPICPIFPLYYISRTPHLSLYSLLFFPPSHLPLSHTISASRIFVWDSLCQFQFLVASRAMSSSPLGLFASRDHTRTA